MARAKFSVKERDTGWAALRATAEQLKGGASAKVGILENAPKPEDEDGAALPFTMASLGAIHEFGSKDGTIPERSFIRAGIDANESELREVARKVARGIYEGRFDVEKGLGILGTKGAAAIRKFVTKGDQVPPPNAPSTVRQKVKKGAWRGRGPVDAAKLVRTLVDTGRMIGSVTYAVEIGGDVKHLEPVPGAAP